MTVLVVGSVAYDSVTTPAASREDSLGGSAMYFSVGVSNFAPVSLVAVIGDDFQQRHIDLLRSRGVDVSGLQRQKGGTFRWAGEYFSADLNARTTLGHAAQCVRRLLAQSQRRAAPQPISVPSQHRPRTATRCAEPDGATPPTRRPRLHELLD